MLPSITIGEQDGLPVGVGVGDEQPPSPLTSTVYSGQFSPAKDSSTSTQIVALPGTVTEYDVAKLLSAR
jgi:hypothetical protein